jgi:hypothetical protein
VKFLLPRGERQTWIAVFLLLASTGAVAQDRAAFTFTHYNLAATISPREQALEIRGTVTLRNDSPTPRAEAFLQLSSTLRWATVRAGGKTLEFSQSELQSDLDHTGSMNEARVKLPTGVQPGQSIELEVGYRGTVSLSAKRLEALGTPAAVATHTDYDRISPDFTLLRGVGHVLWFPAALEPAVLGDGNKVFTESSQWKVRHAATQMNLKLRLAGAEQRVITNADSAGKSDTTDEQVFHWKRLGIATPAIVAGDYEVKEGRMTLAYLPEHREEALDYFSVIQRFQPPLTGAQPRTPVLVDLPSRDDQPFDAGSIFLMPLKTVQQASLELNLAYIWAHATILSPRPWISEGSAHFAQALMRERQEGRKAALQFLDQRRSSLVLAEPDFTDETRKPEPAGQSLIDASDEIYYRTKAMYVWWMLHDMLGAATVQQALASYKPEDDKSPSYVQKLLEAQSHKDLEWFFDDWVYRDRGLPEFKISNVYVRESLSGIYLVTATIANSGAAAAEAPVIVTTASGDVNSRLRIPAKGGAVARIQVGSKPLSVLVNDGSIPEADLTDNTAQVTLPQTKN